MLMDSATDFGGGYSRPTPTTWSAGRSASARPSSSRSTSRRSRRGLLNSAGARLRQGEGVRDGLPERHDRRRAWPRAGRRRDPAGRPGHRLRHARQRGPRHRPHDDPDRQGRDGRATSCRAVRAAGGRCRSSARRRPTSSPTSCAGTRSAASTRSGASSRSAGRERRRRPATLKTGTNNDAKDLNAYGYIAPPTDGRPRGGRLRARRRGVERQQRQHAASPRRPTRSSRSTSATFVWQGFLNEATRQVARDQVRRPDGLDPRRHRRLHRHARRPRLAVGRGVVHRGHRAAGAARPKTCGDRCLRRRRRRGKHGWPG